MKPSHVSIPLYTPSIQSVTVSSRAGVHISSQRLQSLVWWGCVSYVATASTNCVPGDQTGGVVVDVAVRPAPVGIDARLRRQRRRGGPERTTTHVMCKLRTSINCWSAECNAVTHHNPTYWSFLRQRELQSRLFSFRISRHGAGWQRFSFSPLCRAGLRLNWAWCCCSEKAYFLLGRGETPKD